MSTSPVPIDGRSRRRRQSWHAVQQAAVRLVSERGYADVTADDIAVAAGVSRRTFFNLFPTKAAALFDAAPEDRERLSELLAGIDGARPVWPALREALVAFTSGHEDVLAVRRRLVAESPDLDRYHQAAHAHVTEAMRQWTRQQLPEDAFLAALLARSVEAVLLSAFDAWRPEDDPALFPRLVARGFDELAVDLAP